MPNGRLLSRNPHADGHRHRYWAHSRSEFAQSELYPANLCVYAGLINILCGLHQGLERTGVCGDGWILCPTSDGHVACSSFEMSPRSLVSGQIRLENMQCGRCFGVEAVTFCCIRNRRTYEVCETTHNSRLKPCDPVLLEANELTKHAIGQNISELKPGDTVVLKLSRACK